MRGKGEKKRMMEENNLKKIKNYVDRIKNLYYYTALE
jgi:hypothetical protein